LYIRYISENIEWFIEDQAFSLSYAVANSPPLPPLLASCLSFSVQFFCVTPVRGEGRGRGKSQIIRQRESLVFFNWFNSLCPIGMRKAVN
jgi:hypothetical protein